MKAKSLRNYEAAKTLQGNCNGMANRAYYALYQAIVSELETTLRLKPEDLDTVAKEKKLERAQGDEQPEKWGHSIIRSYAVLGARLSFDSKERALVKTAWRLRVKADYQPDDVYPDEIDEVMAHEHGKATAANPARNVCGSYR